MTRTPGERLFSRYAYAPNELGYCGPAGAQQLAAVARGDGDDVDVRAAAARFSGAWVYQRVIGRMLRRDPLDLEVVRGYWTGNKETAQLDRSEFWRLLISDIGPRAGGYWRHLGDDLAAEAAPSHAFHVLGVYPWSRMLPSGRPEPVEVLESCCVRPGRVVSVATDGLEVESDSFVYRGGRLGRETVRRCGIGAPFDPGLGPGDAVALHWGTVCDRLTEPQASVLSDQLAEQIDHVNARLARERG